MSFNIGGLSVQGPIVTNLQNNKETAEQAITSMIQEVKNDPAKNLREMQKSSPFSQFLDIKA